MRVLMERVSRVYARWRNASAFKAAMEENPEAQRGRARLSKWGESKANMFRVEGVYLPCDPNFAEFEK